MVFVSCDLLLAKITQEHRDPLSRPEFDNKLHEITENFLVTTP